MNVQALNTSTQPFTMTNFDIDKWNSILSQITNLNDTDTHKTLSDLQKVLHLIQELNTVSRFQDYFKDATIQDYFCKKFIPKFTNTVLQTEQVDSFPILHLSNTCLEQVALFWSRTIYGDHAKLNEMAAALFKVDQPYFKSNDKEDILPSVIPSFSESQSQEHQSWISALKQGELIDCIKQTRGSIDMIMCWSHAKVIQVSTEMIKVAFLEEDANSTIKDLNRMLNMNEIAPYKTKCIDFDWRMNLKQGDELDVLDMTCMWHSATVEDVRTILNLKTNETCKSVLIGYRRYDENGTKFDSQARRFVGWTSTYDEWITISSPRLCMEGVMTRNVLYKKHAYADSSYVVFTNDGVYKREEDQLYALTRPKLSKSTFLVRMINRFGAEGGFDKILTRIQDTQNYAPLDIVVKLVSIVSGISKLLFRDFAINYIPELKDAVWSYLLEDRKYNIKELTQKQIGNIIEAFNLLLSIPFSSIEKDEMLETLTLELNILCACSDSSESSLQGVTALSAMARKGMNFIKPQYITKQMLESKIIERIYGPQSNPRIIQASAQLFTLIVSQEKFSSKVLAAFFKIVRKTKHTIRAATYGLLNFWRLKLNNTQIGFIIQEIIQIPFDELDICEFELLHNVSAGNATITSCLIKRVLWFVSEYIIYNSQKSGIEDPEIIHLLDSWFEKWTDDEQGYIDLLCECMNHFKEGNDMLSSLLIMRRLIDKAFKNSLSVPNDLQQRFIEELFIKNNLIKYFLKNGREEYTLDELNVLTNKDLSLSQSFAEFPKIQKEIIADFLKAIKDVGISHQGLINQVEQKEEFVEGQNFMPLLSNILKYLDTK